MTKNEIVDYLARNKEVEKIANKFKTRYRDDLCQYIYLWLLTNADEAALFDAYINGTLNNYISGIVYRQVISRHSFHYRYNVKDLGESISSENGDGKTYEETLTYDNTVTHELEDKVDKVLDSLPEMDREIIWLTIAPNQERSEDLERICRKNGITYKKYQKLLPEIKRKLTDGLGYTIPVNGRSGGYKNSPVLMVELGTNKKVREFKNMKECLSELTPKGYSKLSIYECVTGRQKQYKGYIFRYI